MLVNASDELYKYLLSVSFAVLQKSLEPFHHLLQYQHTPQALISVSGIHWQYQLMFTFKFLWYICWKYFATLGLPSLCNLSRHFLAALQLMMPVEWKSKRMFVGMPKFFWNKFFIICFIANFFASYLHEYIKIRIRLNVCILLSPWQFCQHPWNFLANQMLIN